MRDIKIIIASPAGNTTAFVLSAVEQKDYMLIGKEILARKDLGVEQVAFVKSFSSQPRMEMCGMEFCGNAGRAFGLLCAKQQGIVGHASIEISESGCNHNLLVEVNTSKNTASISMPLPKYVITLEDTGLSELQGAVLVDLDGIMHVVLQNTNIEASLKVFGRIKDFIMEKFNPPAMGVMFVKADKSMVPIVYVRDVDSTYEEGSCGSGTTACAIAWSQGCKEKTKYFVVRQPAGAIDVNVELTNGKVNGVSIGGPVELSDVLTLSLNC